MLIIWTNNWSGVTLIYELEREKKTTKKERKQDDYLFLRSKGQQKERVS